MATLGLLNVNVSWNKGYGVIISVHDVINKILSVDSTYTVYVVKWPKFGNSSISMREVTIASILYGFDQKKKLILSGGLGSSSIIWDWHKVWTLNFTPVWQKEVKTESQKVLEANSYVCRS